MPRIAGVDIPEKKKILYALQYVHGIGPKFAKDILAEANIDPDKRANTLTDQELSSITTVIDGGYIVEGAPRRQVSQHISAARHQELSRRTAPQGPAGSRSPHSFQRPHPQGPQEDGRRQEGREGLRSSDR